MPIPSLSIHHSVADNELPVRKKILMPQNTIIAFGEEGSIFDGQRNLFATNIYSTVIPLGFHPKLPFARYGRRGTEGDTVSVVRSELVVPRYYDL